MSTQRNDCYLPQVPQNYSEAQESGEGRPSIDSLDIVRFSNLHQNQHEFFKDMGVNNFEKIISNEVLEPESSNPPKIKKEMPTKMPKSTGNRYINTITFLNQARTMGFGPSRRYKKFQFSPRCGLFEKSLSKHIFKMRQKFNDLKKLGTSKFFVRLFLKYFNEFESSAETCQYNEKIAEKMKKTNQNFYTLSKQMSQFLDPQLDQNSRKISSQNRQILYRILRTKLRKEILFNRQILKNRMAYFIASKVYALRCRSVSLCSKGSFK